MDNFSMSNVILFPDFENLKHEVEKMRTELSMLLLERDELQFVICKNIETEYMLKLGGIEYKAYEAQCAALRLKRKIELIQAKKNRQEFEKDIFLFDTYVAGTTHIEGIEELEPHLKVEDKLDFFREPDNQYDSQAIVIKTESGVKIGYVPKQDNVIFARLMDAGKLLFGRISAKEKKGAWVKLDMKVYLHE